MANVYPFDPTGTSSANRIVNEQHVITAQNFRDYHYVIPNFAPLFEDNMVIRLQYANGNIRPLTLGVDYYLSNQFLDASRACAKPVYGSISFLDTDTAGVLSISYNTVGGMWNLSTAEITRILAEEMRNPRITAWEQITNLPQRFPVIDHEWDLIDMVGMSSVVESIDQIRDAILEANSGGLAEHINNYSNPHNTTKLQVGLGSVENFPIATVGQAQSGTSNAFYMTPLRTRDAISAIAGAMLTTHSSNTSNPHGTTKAQVGLAAVENYPVADQTLAAAGINNLTYMTPLRTAQAIAALVGNNFNTHAADEQNPHNVTKDQIGLFNLSNYAVASAEEARAGSSNTLYMTPLRTTQLVTEFVTTQLDGHATRTDNPHGVTKTQIGLGSVQNFPIATVLQAQTGDSNAAYMTPGRTFDAINALAAPASHVANKNNPHETTAEQVGAYSTTQTDTMLGGYVRNTDQWVAGMSKESFVAEVLSGTAANSMMLEGRSFQDVLDQAAGSYDSLYAQTNAMFSRDVSKTVNPVATPHRWILLGDVMTLSNIETESVDSIAITHPDAYWLATGGHKQEATPALNAAAQSPMYLVHAKNGLTAPSHTFGVTRLAGSADSDIRFGYTYDNASSTMLVWARVNYGYNDLSLVRLTPLGNNHELDNSEITVEPIGIVYATTVAYATTTALSAAVQRIADAEQAIIDAAQATSSAINAINEDINSINNTITGIGETITDMNTALTEIDVDHETRIAALEDSLNSMTVV